MPEHTRGSQEFGSKAEFFPVDCRQCCRLSVLDLPQRSCMTGSGRDLSLCLSLIEHVILCPEPWMKLRCKGVGHTGPLRCHLLSTPSIRFYHH